MDSHLKNNWTIRPSCQQKITETLLLAVSLLILQPLLGWLELGLLFVLLVLFISVLWRGRQAVELRCHQSQWYLNNARINKSIHWRAGSVRRKNLIIWRYGFWPWQRLVVYPDSLPQGEFRLLLKALYGVG